MRFESRAVTGLDEAGVFATYRDEIEHAASAKYDRGQISPDGRVYVSSDEFPNQPPR
jgi:hypothetical protein